MAPPFKTAPRYTQGLFELLSNGTINAALVKIVSTSRAAKLVSTEHTSDSMNDIVNVAKDMESWICKHGVPLIKIWAESLNPDEFLKTAAWRCVHGQIVTDVPLALKKWLYMTEACAVQMFFKAE